jgi:hypothetical protein
MSVEDVYLLMLHEPYASSEHPVPINATIVHALTLLHPAAPQPDGSRMHRCLTEFPSRTPGCLVPLSTLTFELDGGLLWPEIADWKRVVDAVVRLARDKACDAMPLGLPPGEAASLADGPYTEENVYRPDGSSSTISTRERQQYIYIANLTASGPFWPGDGLIDPSTDPLVMPYKPYRSWCPAHSMSPRLHPGAAHRTVCGSRTADRRCSPNSRARFMAEIMH